MWLKRKFSARGAFQARSRGALRALLALLLVCLAYPKLIAGEIFIYKDKQGVINLTDRPVPRGTRVQQVIRYRAGDSAETGLAPERSKTGVPATGQKSRARQINTLKKKAERARQAAETERVAAREKIEAAEAYLERYKEKRRSQRRRYRQEAQRIAREAEEARTRANAAVVKANAAQEEVRKAIAEQAEKPR